MSKKKTVLISGSFNILHPGHLRLLRFASELGHKLIVAVYSDAFLGNGSHIEERFRLEGIQANNWVSEAFLTDEPIVNIIKRLKPDYVVKGKEYEGLSNPEQAAVETYGGKLIFCSGEATFSSLDLIRRNISQDVTSISVYPTQFMDRHGLTESILLKTIDRFSNVNVCVIGDLIIDEYIACEALGMSQEEPTIVVTPVDKQNYVGGAGIVAAHAASLGAKVDLISVIGDDEVGRWAKNKIDNYGINPALFTDSSRPTTLKQRYRANGKSLLRVSHLHQNDISVDIQDNMFRHFKENLKKYDAIIFSDFSYGCLPQRLVNLIGQSAKKQNITMVADSQCSSQHGDVSRFHYMDMILATEYEIRQSLRNKEDGIIVLAEKLRLKTSAKNLMVKLGAEGVILHFQESDCSSFVTDKLEALNMMPIDVSGAGDSMLATVALTLASNGTPWEATCISAVAAAIQVGRIGNIPLSADELMRNISHLRGLSRL